MKDYLSIEKGISEIIHKLNKLKKTAKDVCINISVTKKRVKKSKKNGNRSNTNKKLNTSKGNQSSNVYKSPNESSRSVEINEPFKESPGPEMPIKK